MVCSGCCFFIGLLSGCSIYDLRCGLQFPIIFVQLSFLPSILPCLPHLFGRADVWCMSIYNNCVFLVNWPFWRCITLTFCFYKHLTENALCSVLTYPPPALLRVPLAWNIFVHPFIVSLTGKDWLLPFCYFSLCLVVLLCLISSLLPLYFEFCTNILWFSPNFLYPVGICFVVATAITWNNLRL